MKIENENCTIGFRVLGFSVSGLYRITEKKVETIRVYWGYIGMMEKKMETTIVCWDYRSPLGILVLDWANVMLDLLSTVHSFGRGVCFLVLAISCNPAKAA